ncbi:hypothetical protein B0H12DRAFT_689339 [Mycena haematopus]|nr:hypothetical protein B0H12DRAFT_689339 [Mycena haematopus]
MTSQPIKCPLASSTALGMHTSHATGSCHKDTLRCASMPNDEENGRPGRLIHGEHPRFHSASRIPRSIHVSRS